MDSDKINSSNATTASTYIRKKFDHFKKGLYTKASRRKKCMEYWIAADPSRRHLVEEIYQMVFKELLDIDVAEQLEEARELAASKNVKVESRQWAKSKKHQRAQAITVLATLKKWRDEGEYQTGDGFMDRLQSITSFMEEDDLTEMRSFKSEYNAFFEKELTSSLERTDKSISHEGSFIAAAKQHARVEFDVFDLDWGRISGFFEENFKAGIWANESAKLSWKRTGFTAEVQAAIAMGAQLNIEGELSWENRDRKLTLGGEGEVFMGAKADLSGKLSVNALKGLEAAFDAGFFVGVSASVRGSASFSYMGKVVASVSGEASFEVGIGGRVTASLSVPLFGPTTISFGAGLTIGLGASTSVEIKINFNEMRILLTTEFRKVIYIPTLLQGYKMDLMNQDYRNSFFLNKCITRTESFIKELDEEIRVYKKTPVEKRSLLK